MTIAFSQDLNSVRDYYTKSREVGGGAKTIYQIWEAGDAYDDSVTPSTYCPEYQRHVVLKLQSIASDSSLFSIGCGNASVEARLAQQGFQVRAVDCNEEAVCLARQKHVDAALGDVMRLPPHSLEDVSVVYADGLVGHLFDPERGLRHFFDKLMELGLKKGSYVFISNDAPPDGRLPVERHARVKDFWYVSVDYLARALTDAGFSIVERYTFPYVRPQSGLRQRAICLARA